MIADALDDWVVKGRHTRPGGRQSWRYLAYAPGLGKLLRVVVSIDDSAIVTAFPDSKATEAWEKGDWAYFERHLEDLEVRKWH